MRNKKGLSAIITTLMIILIVLVAVGIIWVVVRNVVEEGAESIDISTKCLAFNVQAVSVVNTSLTTYDVTLNREAGGDDMGGLKVVFFNSTSNSQVLDFGTTIDALGTVTRNIDPGITNANKVEFTVFVLDASGNEQLCSQTSSFNF